MERLPQFVEDAHHGLHRAALLIDLRLAARPSLSNSVKSRGHYLVEDSAERDPRKMCVKDDLPTARLIARQEGAEQVVLGGR